MSNLTEQDARKRLLTEVKGVEIKKVGNYKEDYLFFAPNKEIGEVQDLDAYYIVKKSNGLVARFVPTYDIKGFVAAFKNSED